MAMNALDAGTITACVLALVLLLLFTTYTWLKWRRRELQRMRRPQETVCTKQNPIFEEEMQNIDEKPAHENLQAMGHMAGSISLLNKTAEKEFYPKHTQATPQLSHAQVYNPKESSISSKMDFTRSPERDHKLSQSSYQGSPELQEKDGRRARYNSRRDRGMRPNIIGAFNFL
ncbi:predicted protein [Nematostella vectensis]|uniref:Uncharacterized protein n=1 Tax=Nematostella vectensis TaxID=45351 RepID=A7SMJ6_NEMVE|nr:predicted protein [Nematostella vectensis]|eukprot:XP_001627169.1 predicted protein [Nematostella vectensis]